MPPPIGLAHEGRHIDLRQPASAMPPLEPTRRHQNRGSRIGMHRNHTKTMNHEFESPMSSVSHPYHRPRQKPRARSLALKLAQPNIRRTTTGIYPSNLVRVRMHHERHVRHLRVLWERAGRRDAGEREFEDGAARDEIKAKWSDASQIDAMQDTRQCAVQLLSDGVEYQRSLQLSILSWIFACPTEE
ncbi:hypothetical protein B0H12DRAFT_94460 [Mycena haematopus]|nr:hypothetical protein B0H12DRAFT_94460 [Mycena haematopus]